jgi:hypothetical protein
MTSVVGDIGLRFQEGVQDLKIGQQLAPTREAISKTFATGSTNFLKAVEGVKGRWMARSPSAPGTPPDSGRGTPVDLGKDSDAISVKSSTSAKNSPAIQQTQPPAQQTGSPPVGGSELAQRAASTLSGWGNGIGSFISNRASKFSLGSGVITIPTSTPATATTTAAPKPDQPENIPEQFVPRDLDAEREKAEREKVEKKLPVDQQKT